MSYRVIDIETVPLAASMEAPYAEAERQPPANYKNPDAIASWRERDIVAWQGERAKVCSLSPRLGRVLCVGVGHSADTVVHYGLWERDERETLRAFWESITDHGLQRPCKVVTWNGAWDLRFLLVRSLLHGLDIPVDAHILRDWQRPYNTINHTDVKRVLVGDGITKGEGLDEWATAFGLIGKTGGWTGGSVYPAYLEEQHDDIQAYCQRDVEATRALYLRVAHLVED